MNRIRTSQSTLNTSDGKACPDCFYEAMNADSRVSRMSRRICREIAKDNAIDISRRCETHRKERRLSRAQARQKKINPTGI